MAALVDVGSIASRFEALEDPRHTRNRRHLLGDILVIAVAGVICGCDGPTAIHRWARERLDWLKSLLALPNGLPSRDCLRRTLIMIRPEAFQQCFQEWVAEAFPRPPDHPEGRLVAIDGKTCRRSHDAGRGLGPLHLVSAWASEEGLALGQVATEEKSNEITAVPELLKRLCLKDMLITIDAAGCQKEIVKAIRAGGGDAVIALKGNQPRLHEAVVELLAEQVERDFEDVRYHAVETSDEGHGRRDDRSYRLVELPRGFAAAKDWPWIKAVGFALRLTTHADGRQSSDVRDHISTRFLSGKRFAEAVRGHWGIESMHWTLDVTFREDDGRARERTLTNNLSWLRRFAVSLLKRHPARDSLRGKMLRCGYNPAFLTEVLKLQ